MVFFFFQAEDGIRDLIVTGVQTCALPILQAARARIFAACKANKIFFLNSMNPTNVVDMIKEGVMIGPASQQTAEIGRKYTRSGERRVGKEGRSRWSPYH